MKSPRYPSLASRQGFTLIELLTVIAIIGILAAIIIPVVGKVRNAAKASQALSNAKQLGVSMLLYSQDNRNEILGLRDGAQSWNGIEFLLNQTARYLAKTPAGNRDVTISAHRQIMDPLVPENLQLYSNTYYHTWAINRIFNVNAGRSVQGVGPGYYGADVTGRPRRATEFDAPSRVIYAVSGGYELTVGNAANPLVSEPVARQTPFYYHRDGNATPAVFLDGHTEMLNYPIDPKRINPSLP